MNWIFDYQVALFDFDGLLVDTEPLHYAAYMQMAQERGLPLDWDFTRFCKEAHAREEGFFYALEREYPFVFQNGLSKKTLYAHKKQIYVQLLEKSSLCLMPGAESVLEALKKEKIPCAVVTNSPRTQVEFIQSKIPLLRHMDLWITREDYERPKPFPDGYLTALARLGALEKKSIGFEDTLKGIKSLRAAHVDAVLICPSSLVSVIEEATALGALHQTVLSLTLPYSSPW